MSVDQIAPQKSLSNDQLLKMEAAVLQLSKVTHNAQAITLAHNLKMSKDIEEKRRWIVLFYASCFQLLSFMNMARDNQDTLSEFEKKLGDLFIPDMMGGTPNGK